MFLSWFVMGAATSLQGGEKSTARPNLVVILADDLGYSSLGCYGSKEIKTPHIDRLAGGGVRLTDFHSNGAMCTPTRAALMTGRYPQRCVWVDDSELTPIFRQQRKENPVQRWAWGISAKELTMPEVLAGGGYRTALIGKWHLGYDTKFHPMKNGFDEFHGFVGGGVDYHSHVATHGGKELDWWNGEKIVNEIGYTTDLLSRHAVDFIQRSAAKASATDGERQPFFLLLAHAAPHSPWQGRDAQSKKSKDEVYREMIEILDESVCEIVASLRTQGLEKETLVIFCSDNGPQAPSGILACDPLQGKKGSMLEGGHRVPCIASWPGVIAAGKTSDEVVMSMDFFPSLAKLAGVEIPAAHVLDGVDFISLLKEEKKMPARTLHWRHGADWAVRKGAWKLTGRGKDARVLVNLAEDQREKNNLIRHHPQLAKDLLGLHYRWIAEVGER